MITLGFRDPGRRKETKLKSWKLLRIRRRKYIGEVKKGKKTIVRVLENKVSCISAIYSASMH